MRLVLIVAVGERDDGRNAGIRIPCDAFGVHGGVKTERAVFLVQTVTVAARQKRANEEPHTFALAEQTPADLREL